MFDKKTVIICSALIIIGAVASGPQLLPFLFMVTVTGVVSVVLIPIARWFVAFIWHVALKHGYERIESKNGKAIFKLIFAPPKKYM
jgi:hypothetical protein